MEFRTFLGSGAERDGGVVAPLRGVGENIEKDAGHFSGERVSRGHRENPLAPQRSAQCGERISERGCALGCVPREGRPGDLGPTSNLGWYGSRGFEGLACYSVTMWLPSEHTTRWRGPFGVATDLTSM